MIAIQDMYRQNFKIDNHGIEGYHVAQKYESLGKAKPLVGADKKKPHATKRGSFLDD